MNNMSSTSTGRRLGYMRVSTDSQDELLQRQALEKAGADALYMDHAASGTTTSRPKLDKMLADMQRGDTVVFYSLSRLSRGTKHLLELSERFEQAGVAMLSCTETDRHHQSCRPFRIHTPCRRGDHGTRGSGRAHQGRPCPTRSRSRSTSVLGLCVASTTGRAGLEIALCSLLESPFQRGRRRTSPAECSSQLWAHRLHLRAKTFETDTPVCNRLSAGRYKGW